MVQKSKGGKKSRSVKKGKVLKDNIQYNRKFNYKKKKDIKKEECCICYEKVIPVKDNMISCGKNTNHILCSQCKIKIGNNDCPMCRSHKLPIPINQTMELKVVSKKTRFSLKWSYQDELDVLYYKEYIRPRHLTK